jgi:hypothetical protein
MMTAVILLAMLLREPPMQTPREILSALWTSVGGGPSALEAVTLTGDEPQLPSSFRVAAAAQASVAAAGLAAAKIWKWRSGQSQDVAVDMRHAVVECRSERYLRVNGKPPPPAWDVIAGIYKTRDHRFVRLHTNFPHHRDAVCKVLNCKPERDDVQAALMQSGPCGGRIQGRGFRGRCGPALSGNNAFGFRSAQFDQPFSHAVKNAGILVASGDAARQSPAAMAGA